MQTIFISLPDICPIVLFFQIICKIYNSIKTLVPTAVIVAGAAAQVLDHFTQTCVECQCQNNFWSLRGLNLRPITHVKSHFTNCATGYVVMLELVTFIQHEK